MEITVEFGLRAENTTDAAKLYSIAFERKFTKLIGDKEIMTMLLSNSINPNCAISAYNNKGELLGLAGYRYKNQMMININKKSFYKIFGIIHGYIKYFITKLLYTRNADSSSQLLMDGIAVDENYRGNGVGKLLFLKLEEFAKMHNLTSIKLDVIDENPRAKKLYENIGFQKVKYKKMNSFIKNLICVSGVTTMIKELIC